MEENNNLEQGKEETPLMIYELPEEIKRAGKEVIEKWLEWKKIDEFNKTHPDRFQYVVNQAGERVTLDMLGWPTNIERIAKKAGVKKKELADIMDIQKRFAVMKMQKGAAMKAWSKLLNGSGSYSKNVIDIEKAKLLELFGQHYTVNEVFKIVTQQLGYHVDERDIRKFKNDNDILIQQKKAEYVLRNRDFRLSTETGRLEEYSDLYWQFKQKFNENQRPEYLRELRALLECFRKEVKGDEIRLTVDGKIDINATIHANKTVMELARKIPIHMLVIGLVAARQNIDPTQIMASLASSYYAKLNGFNGVVDNEEDKKEIIYPSAIIKQYDWGEIQRISESGETEGIKSLKTQLEYSDVFIQDQAKKRKESVRDLIRKHTEMNKAKLEDRDKIMKG